MLSDETIRDDFLAFLEERDYSLSYKMPFLLSFLDHVDSRDLGEVSLNHALLARMSDGDWDRVRAQMRAGLEDFHVRTCRNAVITH